MLSAKDALIMARATRSRGSVSHRTDVRRRNAGQSLIVAIIVLFILLFLGGVFIALIANNLRNTRRGLQVSAADKFAEAGIKYLDQQLMTSPEGADWRPVPESYVRDAADYNGPNDDPTIDDNGNGIVNGTVGPNDPDYRWLKFYDPATGEGGYTRVNFGGPTPSQSNLGGRALVRLSYRPYRVTATGVFWDDLNNDGVFDAGSETVAPESVDRTRRYLKLESIGRVGVVDSLDPTTYRNSEGPGLRRELVAYKALGLTEALRFITDKDKRRTPAALGAPYPVQDRASVVAGDNTSNYLFGGLKYDATTQTFTPVGGFNADNSRRPDDTAQIVNRPIYGVYQGGIRSNTDLTFYGMNFLSLDARRGESIEVAGNIGLNGLSDATTTPGIDKTKVYVYDRSTGANPTFSVAALGTPAITNVGNVLPSGSGSFSTFGGLVRDNPRGNETQDLPADTGNNNLRAVPRLEPPLIDTVIGDNGLTRYRSLTRDSVPMPASQTGTKPVLIDRRYAGAYGWGENLYIPNAVDLPSFVEVATNTASQRSEWLNPTLTADTTATNWRTDGLYVPPAVTITLTPRWFSLNQSQTGTTRNRSYLRNPTDGRPALRSNLGTVYRYTYDATGALATAPTKTIDEGTGTGTVVEAPKFAGYPAVKVAAGYYEGDFVIFAEGNIRIKGSVGGIDPETGEAFVRHLTVVSNGTIYVDGNLLRDNISPQMANANDILKRAKGKSSIALLAKNYIAVNTTQFLAPGDTTTALTPAAGAEDRTIAIKLAAETERVTLNPIFGPITTYNGFGLPNIDDVYTNAVPENDMNRTPPYLNDPANVQANLSMLLRHGSTGGKGQSTKVKMFINPTANPPTYKNLFDWNAGLSSYPLVADNGFVSNVFPLNLAGANATYLYPNNQYPFTTPVAQIPTIGIRNLIELSVDKSSGDDQDYLLNRFGIVPMDVRIEALMYAQEGSFFIIPGSWVNTNTNDTLSQFIRTGTRPTDSASVPPVPGDPIKVDPKFPFYGEPLDIRITMFGSISENLPAEIGDQGAWLQKWGWIPRFNGSDNTPTFHGASYNAPGYPNVKDGVGNGINYIYDPRLASPYAPPTTTGDLWRPIRSNPYFPSDPLPPMPRLPVAPGLLYYGDRPIQ